jgi:hypothetical protein
MPRLKALRREFSEGKPDAERQCEAGLFCLRLGQPEEGERYLLAALRDDPAHREARKALEEHDEKTGRRRFAGPHRAAPPP